MNTTIWLKYLPVLRLVLKRSLTAEQQFSLNTLDFEKIGNKSKPVAKFLLKLKEGKLTNILTDSPLASALATTILNDNAMMELLRTNEFHISMNGKYQLTIKHILHHPKQLQAIAEVA
ncbi:MAG: hypothetical protein EON98_13045 [Chitinophagaceae bacterium]|nr:MAG: hypothetical protein EON98_13045 [Chitinophagaceae bacterium]